MDKNKRIQYILPGFTNYGLNEIMINIYQNYPEITKNDSTIYSFFGTFPKAIWNGGRPDLSEPEYSLRRMKKIRNYYNSKNISIAFTFTNSLIEEEHLDDKYCNDILKVFHNGKNEVLINSKILEKYIRENYPKYKLNHSITATENVDYLLEGYHLGVLKKSRTNDFEFLKQVPNRDRENIEILCNEMCVDNCPYTYSHYREMDNVQLGRRRMFDEGLYGFCKYTQNYNQIFTFKWLKDNSGLYIDPDDIYGKYIPLGYRYFKLQGRERFNNNGLTSIIYKSRKKYQEDVGVYIKEHVIFEAKKYYLELFDKLNQEEYSTKKLWEYV